MMVLPIPVEDIAYLLTCTTGKVYSAVETTWHILVTKKGYIYYHTSPENLLLYISDCLISGNMGDDDLPGSLRRAPERAVMLYDHNTDTPEQAWPVLSIWGVAC